MSARNKNRSIAYLTMNGKIPSTSANSVGVMTMCGQFASQGLDTLLLVPDRQSMPLAELSSSGDVFDFYSVPKRFEFCRFPNFLAQLSRFTQAYALAMVLYVKARGIRLITTRSLEVAIWAARFDMPVILESHNFLRFSKSPHIDTWVRLIQKSEKPLSMVVTTQAGKTSYVRIGVPEYRVRVLPNGVDVERFNKQRGRIELRAELGLPSGVPIVAFSGSLHEGRGGEEMLDCASLLPNVKFVIVGGAVADVQRYRDLCKQKQLANVQLVGHISQAVLPKYLLAADILLMPYTTRFSEHSFEYTSPMKMFEYLATGRPIVATDFLILHEILEHRRNVWFVPPDSGAALACGVKHLLDHPEDARRIGAAAHADAQKYSWQARAGAIIRWQQELGHLS